MTASFFSFNLFSVFPTVTTFASFYILYLLNTKAYPSIITRLISVFFIFTIVSGIGEALARASSTASATDFWQLFNLPIICFYGPLLLTVALTYTGRNKLASSFWYQLLAFGPGAFFLFLGLATPYFQNKDISNFRHYYYGWNDSGDSLIFWTNIALIMILNCVGIILIWLYRKKLNDKTKRKQSLLFLIAFLIPAVSGMIIDGIIQGIFGPIFPLVYISSLSITGFILAFAVLRYGLFVVNPSTVASNILETMNEVLFVFNPNNYIDFANNAVADILGYKKNTLINRSVKDIVSSSWVEFEEEIIKPVKDGVTVSGVELSLKAINGEIVPVAFSASSIRDTRGSIAGFIGIASDLRKIKSLTASVEKAKNRIETINTIVNSVINGILVLDLENKIVLVNPSILSILGVKEDDVLHKNIEEVFVLKEKSIDIPTNNLISSSGSIIEKKGLEIFAKKPTLSLEKPTVVDITTAPIKNGKEFFLSNILVFTDKTREFQLEAMKLDFVTMAAHELRTPLTSIRGYVSSLVEDLTMRLDKEHKDQLQMLSLSVNNLNSLVENILNVSNIERGIVHPIFSLIDIVSLADISIRELSPLAKSKKLKIVFNPDDNVPAIIGDKFRINEVIQNLLENAINYTQEKGEISIDIKIEENSLVFSLRDTGPGIPKKDIPHLFTKFFRVEGKLKQESKGTGLGLYISKSIIDMHRGKIWAESVLGKGSTFHFSLPIPSKEDLEKYGRTKKVLQANSSNGIFINKDRLASLKRNKK